MVRLRRLNLRDKRLGDLCFELGERDLKLRFTGLPQPEEIRVDDLGRIRDELESGSLLNVPTRALRSSLRGVLDHHIHELGSGRSILVSDSEPEISFGLQQIYDERISTFLSDKLKDHSFIMVGEKHGPEQDPQKCAVAKSLARLKSEGLTHVAVELHSDIQELVDGLDYASPDIKDELRGLNASHLEGWSEGNLEILIAAKKACLNVLCIDLAHKSDDDTENARWENKRDKWMQKIIDKEVAPKWMRLKKMLGRNVSPTGKMLVFIGSTHLPRKPTDEDVDYFHYGKHVTRIGPRLINK